MLPAMAQGYLSQENSGSVAWPDSALKENACEDSLKAMGELRAFEVASTCATESDQSKGLPGISENWKRDFDSFNISSFGMLDLERFQFQHVLRPASDGLHAQIEVHLDRVEGSKVVAKRFPRGYLKDSPAEFRETSDSAEDPWTEMFLAVKLGQVPRTRGVLPCHGVFIDPGSGDVMFIMEYAASGDVFELASCLGEPGPEREAKAAQVLCSLLDAVKRLHSMGVAHCDISAENAILRMDDGEFEVALLDFAMAVYTDLHAASGARGKLMYRAPEAVKDDAIFDARQADLFACGVVGYALAIGNYPWQSTAGGARSLWDRQRFPWPRSYRQDFKLCSLHSLTWTLATAMTSPRCC
ncbi:unnamed protein product [Durusdinium trenchii]|uniref:Protein kinase domain-containing protein n=1 Tax=Durusdinium trenchii TaxID=1381693 RepID=A0ABP0S9W1_9DINO